MTIQLQLIWLFILAIPIACVAWTVTHEEIFAEVNYHAAYEPKRAVRTNRWKYIRFSPNEKARSPRDFSP